MQVVLFAVLLFGTVFVLHWLVWHVWVPRRQILALLILFMAVLPMAVVAAWLWPGFDYWPKDAWQWLHVGLFYVAVSLAYIVVYSVLEQDSPSLTVVVFVAQAGETGRSEQELQDLIGLDFIVGYRFESMLHGGLVEKVEDRYKLTNKGLFWARLFRVYRTLFKLELGG